MAYVNMVYIKLDKEKAKTIVALPENGARQHITTPPSTGTGGKAIIRENPSTAAGTQKRQPISLPQNVGNRRTAKTMPMDIALAKSNGKNIMVAFPVSAA